MRNALPFAVLALVLAAVGAGAFRSLTGRLEPEAHAAPRAERPDPAVIQSGQVAYLRNDMPFGGEKWATRKQADGGLDVQVASIFANVKIRGAGHLVLGPGGEIRSFKYEVQRPGGEARITVTRIGSKARCVVLDKKGGVEQATVSQDVELPAKCGLVEEGIVCLDAVAISRGYDRAKGGEQDVKVLVPQLGSVQSMFVKSLGEERVPLGDAKNLVTTTRYTVRYRDTVQDYWLDADGRLVRCKAHAATGAVEIALVPELPASLK